MKSAGDQMFFLKLQTVAEFDGFVFRGRILDLLFGEFDIAKADNTSSLDRQSASLQTAIGDLPPEAATYKNRVLPNIKDFVNKPHTELRNDTQWTTNGCESLNDILKLAINWRPQQMPELIRTLQAIVGKQFVDLKRSLCGQDNYLLCNAAKKLIINHRQDYLACRKRSMSSPSDVFCDLKCETLVKQSTYARLTFPVFPNAGKVGKNNMRRQERTRSKMN